MSLVTICDDCEKVMKEKLTDFNMKTDDVLVTVALLGEKDRCDVCTRKLQARYLKEAWDIVKKSRKPKKPDLKVAA
jgi:hypothetical protein